MTAKQALQEVLAEADEFDTLGKFTAVQQAAGVPKGRSAAAQYLREFIEDTKASGFVARAIASNKVVGLTVAAKA